ncbi:MAG: 6,7-dimethyl-8-ribityllumazine synthase [Bacteroidota bacterium]|nr:6,7-dimethyl-8-ribityllumazine synthase [Bacteroidota bacterium]
MSGKLPTLTTDQEFQFTHAPFWKLGIVYSEWNVDITSKLLKACESTLIHLNIPKEHIFIHKVPGSFELPLGAKWLADKYKADAIICLGCLIKGETDHDVYISQCVSQQLSQLSIHYSIPFIFGVLTTNNHFQAAERAGGTLGNKGEEAAISALKMLDLKQQIDSSS